MRYLALAVDYDGTLAHHGSVAPATYEALAQLGKSGRKLILVTGRELNDLMDVFPGIELFDRVVAENGALLYRPTTKERQTLGDPPDERFIAELRRRGVTLLAVGASIVATVHPHETVVLEVIRDLGLELQLIFNKGAVMVLPAGVNKASGLGAALDELGLSAHNVVAIGDAENDHSLLALAEYSVAVANAIATLKDAADRVTTAPHGEGVVQLITDLIAHDLAQTPPRALRRSLTLGQREDGALVRIAPAGVHLLVAGSSGSGKSTLATGALERLATQGYQFCVIDPEGDYEGFPEAIVLGDMERAPSAAEVLTALEKPHTNVVVNLIGVPLNDRPAFFLALLPRIQELRSRSGRPHWMLIDEAHHLLPADWEPAATVITEELASMIYVTVHPEWISPAVLRHVNVLATLGEEPAEALAKFCAALEIAPPPVTAAQCEAGTALIWLRASDEAPFKMRIAPSHTERRRHRRKYAEGELPPECSFYFRGPEGKLNLRAHNLILFLQLAEGLDEATWLHHLRQHDYSRWIRDCIKDDALARELSAIEESATEDARESLRLVKTAIEEQYTLPATGAGPEHAPPRAQRVPED
jgi:phosphoglycolate phosphatase (TIGR01487 family)